MTACADGATYVHDRDHTRLASQRERVFLVILDGEWHTLKDISTRTGYPEASVSARLRDFRKPQFGRFDIERRYVSGGLWEYRLVP